jgi:hypothetical protein
MIYELRHYIPKEGCRDALLARFRDDSLPLLRTFGFELGGFWVSRSDGHVWYIVKWRDAADRKPTWAKFLNSAEWREVSARTEPNGPLVERVEVTLLENPFGDAAT